MKGNVKIKFGDFDCLFICFLGIDYKINHMNSISCFALCCMKGVALLEGVWDTML